MHLPHISLKDLTFSYPGCASPSLRAVCAFFESGSFTVLCGKSGCGKTTLLRHLKTVLTPHGETAGQVLFNGVTLDQIDERTQSAEIGFVMQNPDAQVVTDKVWHELAFGLESLGVDQQTMRLRVAEMASYFGIHEWFNKDVRGLSGGQKQLLSLASVMAMRPSVLILDEPTSQLDPIAASDFLNTVRKINVELGTTVILTEHRLEDIYASADQVIVLDEGAVVAAGSPREVGERLVAAGHDMAFALPAPMRIYYGVAAHESANGDSACEDANGLDAHADMNENAPHKSTNGAIAQDASAPFVPMTVREGRTWLSRRYEACPPAVAAFEDPSEHTEDAAAPAISVHNVWFRYERDLPDVLKGVSLSVAPATTFALVGGNGTGKSTLLKVLTSQLKPYRGSVEVLGKKLSAWSSADLFNGGLSMLPQDPANLFAKTTVRAELEEMIPERAVNAANAANAAASVNAANAEERIARVVRTCDIEHLVDAHPLDLSGGEQQRVALAKMLMRDPRVLLLDEPTKGIDNFFKRKLAQIFEDLKAQGRTIVMVSHDVEFCARYADRVAMLFDGQISTTDTPRRFFSQASFYTTAANRMSRHVFTNAITEEDVVGLCLK